MKSERVVPTEPIIDTVRRYPRTLGEAFPDEAYGVLEDVTSGYRKPVSVPGISAPRPVRDFLRKVFYPQHTGEKHDENPRS